MFLSNAGEPFSLDHLSDLVRVHVDASKIGKRGACPLFRHTMATLMLEGGADIRYIQAMPGHTDLKDYRNLRGAELLSTLDVEAEEDNEAENRL